MSLEIARQLLDFTQGVRDDFHAPCQQGITFLGCFGGELDNAGTPGEAEIRLRREGHPQDLHIKLATLIALARVGARQETRYELLEPLGGQHGR